MLIAAVDHAAETANKLVMEATEKLVVVKNTLVKCAPILLADLKISGKSQKTSINYLQEGSSERPPGLRRC